MKDYTGNEHHNKIEKSLYRLLKQCAGITALPNMLYEKIMDRFYAEYGEYVTSTSTIAEVQDMFVDVIVYDLKLSLLR